MSSNLDNGNNTCSGTIQIIIFVLTTVFGTANGILSKVLMSINNNTDGTLSNDDENSTLFDKPLFLTFAMFAGTLLVLPMHWVVMYFKVDFPGYKFDNNDEEEGYDDNKVEGSPQQHHDEEAARKYKIPMKVYFILAIPALCDLVATAMFLIGMQYLNISAQQTLCGSQIIFIVLLRQSVLKKERLLKFQWVGVFWNVVSVVLVGSTALLPNVEGEEGGDDDISTTKIALGVCLTLFGSFTQASQAVIEELVMKTDFEKSCENNHQCHPAPPLLVSGMIGTYTTFALEGLLCLITSFFANFRVFFLSYRFLGYSDVHGRCVSSGLLPSWRRPRIL